MGTVLASILITGLTVLLFLRDRKKEFGIYFSLGESKSNLLSQALGEVLIISLLAIFLSFITGQFLASFIGDFLVVDQLGTQVDYSHNEEFWQAQEAMGEYASFVSDDEVKESFRTGFTLHYLLLFLGVGLSSALLSTIIPSLYLLRLKPREILLD